MILKKHTSDVIRLVHRLEKIELDLQIEYA